MVEVNDRAGTILANQKKQAEDHIKLQTQVDAIDIQLAKKFSHDDSQESSFVEKYVYLRGLG